MYNNSLRAAKHRIVQEERAGGPARLPGRLCGELEATGKVAKRPCRERKLARLHRGETPRVLDLFAGCGGLALGFHAASFLIAACVENEPVAARTFALNFFGDETHPAARPRDIVMTPPDELASMLACSESAESWVDVIVGGPPCQAFARVGRAKLREVGRHPEAFRNDPRARLYVHYLDYVKRLQPLALLVENVPDALNFGGNNIAEVMCEDLEREGYVCRYTLLNAVHYGVPQLRERMFLLAYAEELQTEPVFPNPTHWMEVPRGYFSCRAAALRLLGSLWSKPEFYSQPPTPTPGLPVAITVQEAIGDLPAITWHVDGHKRPRSPRSDLQVFYREASPLSPYARLMREWPGFEGCSEVTHHVIRWLPRDYPIFRIMSPGDEYPQARALADELFRERLRQAESMGHVIEEGSPEYWDLRRKTVPPYDPSKFPNKWRKMEPDAPARTLMAHLGKDSYTHIHYDSEQARTISVREAARLQSFPDGFRFCGGMNAAFRQIGNAVPPLLANALAHAILRALGIRTARMPLARILEDWRAEGLSR